jgi:DNA polymerase delta subunit 2
LPSSFQSLKYCSAQDQYFLEDESGRISLDLNHIGRENFQCVTGVIVALLGAETASGQFLVKDYSFPGLPSPSHLSLTFIPPRQFAS